MTKILCLKYYYIKMMFALDLVKYTQYKFPTVHYTGREDGISGF